MKRQLISSLVMIFILVSPLFGRSRRSGDERTTSEITIRIRNYAHANPSVLHHAEQVAGEILQKAGVVTRWIECPIGSSDVGICSSPFSSLDLVMNLLPESMSGQLPLNAGALGSAIEGSEKNFGYIASIFYDITKDRATEGQLDFGELLGDAIAHELGHLLLGTHSHSSAGLMRAFWSGNQLRLVAQGGLAFSNEEVKRIQGSMNARTLAALDSNRQLTASSFVKLSE